LRRGGKIQGDSKKKTIQGGSLPISGVGGKLFSGAGLYLQQMWEMQGKHKNFGEKGGREREKVSSGNRFCASGYERGL